MSSPSAKPDAFRELLPACAAALPVAPAQVRIPGVPEAFALTPTELAAADPRQRFFRRTIQHLDSGAGNGDGLALVDKAIPHARFDLMLSETSPTDKPTPADVLPATGQALWRTGAAFVRYVGDSAVQREFGLQGGQLHLALNCDPWTRDRESVQAAKQFHLHLLYWTAPELRPLQAATTLGAIADARLRRQLLDPLGFLGARLIAETLAGVDLGLPGARLVGCDDAAVCAARQPPGCVILLPDWRVLESPAFEVLVRRMHLVLADRAADVLEAFTGRRTPAPPWRRHPLLRPDEIHARVRLLGLSAPVTAGLATLAGALKNLGDADADRLRRARPADRKHCMTLNQPCYGINLYVPARNTPDAPIADAGPVYMILQTKLFSGTGVAGLLPLDGFTTALVQRGIGHFTEAEWRCRAEFQAGFAHFNSARLRDLAGIGCAPVRSLADFGRGWV